VKMSKSLGNLVLVSTLTAAGTDPRAIRLALLAQHYRNNWEWMPELLSAAEQRLARLVEWSRVAEVAGHAESAEAIGQLAAILADDLQSPEALDWLDAQIVDGLVPDKALLDAIDALLGVRL